jgi:hypothetical protein
MLEEYPIDPAFNKNLVFAYQPPPEIDVANLPILAENWLEDLQEIICEADSKLPDTIFDKLFCKTPEYRIRPLLKQLELIYHRLQGNLDAELGQLSKDKRQAILSKLTEEIIHCSEGFHNRVNIIIDSFLKPRNLAELLYTVRKELIKEVASTLTDEVHAWNRVSVIAANDGLGVSANFPDDTYSGALSETSIRRALQQTFYKKFTPFQLPCLLTIAFMEFIPELESEKNNENGICLQTQEKITKLIQRFLPKYINEKPNDPNNWKNYFKIFHDEKNSLIFSFVNLDWGKIYQSFYFALSEQNYFKSPQINTLLDSARYNLFLKKNSLHVTAELISKLFKEERYSDLLEQLVELNTQFPDYYLRLSKNKIFTQNCLALLDYLKQKLKISNEYLAEIMQGFHLIIRLDLRRKNFIIGKIADSFLVKNQAGFNLLMLAAQYNPTLASDILIFLKTNEAIIDAELTEKMFLMKNKDNLNALMIAASKQAETIVTILSFLTTHIGRFANDTLRKLFTQQQKDSYTAVTLTARDHPDRLKNILSFITDHIKIDGEILGKLLFCENSNGACTALMLAVKNQAAASFSILDFISKNIQKFDSTALGKIFSEKDQDGFTILMLAARYQPSALQFILTFIDEHKDFFSAENLSALFLEKNPENYNCLMLAAEFQPTFVPTILDFINSKLEIFKSNIPEIVFTKNKKAYNSLLLARHHPTTLASLVNFINNHSIAGVIPDTLEKIFLEKHKFGLTILMYVAKDRASSLKFLFEFIEKHATLFSQETLLRFILEKNDLDYNSLMLAARNQYAAVAYILNFVQKYTEIFSPNLLKQLLLEQTKEGINTLMVAARYQPAAAKLILDFIQKQPEIFSLEFLEQLLMAHDQYGVNALMVAATYQAQVVELLLSFVTKNIKHFSSDVLQEFVFKDIHDKEAANAVFFGGRYNFRKTVLSVTSRLEDPTASNALLKFIDNQIELIGIKIFINLLKEKDNKDNPIFLHACSKYFFPMKKILNFIATLPDFEELIPIHSLLADFIFEQLARWPVTPGDESLFYTVIYNCSPFLLSYFNADRFNVYLYNLETVAKILLCCLNSELERKKTKEFNQYFFFRLFSSTGSELQAAEDLEKTLYTASNKKMALMELGKQSRFLKSNKSNSILSCLFIAFQKIEDLKSNDSKHLQQAMLA